MGLSNGQRFLIWTSPLRWETNQKIGQEFLEELDSFYGLLMEFWIPSFRRVKIYLTSSQIAVITFEKNKVSGSQFASNVISELMALINSLKNGSER